MEKVDVRMIPALCSSCGGLGCSEFSAVCVLCGMPKSVTPTASSGQAPCNRPHAHEEGSAVSLFIAIGIIGVLAYLVYHFLLNP